MKSFFFLFRESDFFFVFFTGDFSFSSAVGIFLPMGFFPFFYGSTGVGRESFFFLFYRTRIIFCTDKFFPLFYGNYGSRTFFLLARFFLSFFTDDRSFFSRFFESDYFKWLKVEIFTDGSSCSRNFFFAFSFYFHGRTVFFSSASRRIGFIFFLFFHPLFYFDRRRKHLFK